MLFKDDLIIAELPKLDWKQSVGARWPVADDFQPGVGGKFANFLSLRPGVKAPAEMLAQVRQGRISGFRRKHKPNKKRQADMGRRKALITGITGQDGSYLAELLLQKDYEVHGVVRRVAIEDPAHRMLRIAHIQNRVKLHAGSMESFSSLYQIVRQVQPDECYHLAAQSFVSYSFDDAFSTLNTNINGTHFLLAALHDIAPRCRFYFAGSSEMFGRAEETPQTENTRFHPRSAYGISKATGFDLTRNYREAYGMHASCGILFNHESVRRGHEFVTRKITSSVAAIAAGRRKELRLGNLSAQRDWGHAPDYVEAMWRMLQNDKPDDYVVATGETHSVREFAELAFSLVDLDYREFVVVDQQLYRPAEVDLLIGNPAKISERLGWHSKTSFQQLVELMVQGDLSAAGVGQRFARAISDR